MNAATETSESFEAPAMAPRPVRPFYWSVMRELWENRSLYIAPAVAGAVAVVALILNSMHLTEGMQILAKLPPQQQGTGIAMLYGLIAVVISLVMNITVFFYLLDSLQGERKDRSVLFWKSMPISDTTTVLSKLFTALVISGVIVVVVTIVTEFAVLLLASAILMIGGASPAPIWGNSQLFQMTVTIIYGQIAAALWYAPVAAWLLLVSAWAKRVTFLWAVFTPVAIIVFERVALGTRYVLDMVSYRLSDPIMDTFTSRARGARFIIQDGNADISQLPPRVFDLLDPVGFFTNPWLWVGLVVAAALVAAAIWMRRYREPI
jgi:ABC-2 type transport system permease protein